MFMVETMNAALQTINSVSECNFIFVRSLCCRTISGSYFHNVKATATIIMTTTMTMTTTATTMS